jgi:hypothetical protein
MSEFFMGPRFNAGADKIEVDAVDLSFVVEAEPIAGPFILFRLEDDECSVWCRQCGRQSPLQKKRPPLKRWARAHRCPSSR